MSKEIIELLKIGTPFVSSLSVIVGAVVSTLFKKKTQIKLNSKK